MLCDVVVNEASRIGVSQHEGAAVTQLGRGVTTKSANNELQSLLTCINWLYDSIHSGLIRSALISLHGV